MSKAKITSDNQSKQLRHMASAILAFKDAAELVGQHVDEHGYMELTPAQAKAIKKAISDPDAVHNWVQDCISLLSGAVAE